MKTVAILGLGLSGIAAAKFLSNKAKCIIGFDKKSKIEELQKTLEFPIMPEEEAILPSDVDLFILSPGVQPDHPLCLLAREKGIEIIGELELGARFIKQPCIGITGTNGKTTAASLMCHVLNSVGMPAKAVGNIGLPLTEYLLAPNGKETLVVEVSSYQLETMAAPCFDVGIILNIRPDHLDRYKKMEDYVKAKLNILKISKKKFVHKEVANAFPELLNGYDFIPFEEENAVFFTICAVYGIGYDAFVKGLRSFQKPPHRLEWVRTLHGVQFVNDSKATNVDAVLYALKSMKGPVILIAGGRPKGESFVPLIPLLKEKGKCVIVMGEAMQQLKEELQQDLPIEVAASLKEAVEKAYSLSVSGDTILLSPACASFDCFQNFEHRGNLFKACVKELV